MINLIISSGLKSHIKKSREKYQPSAVHISSPPQNFCKLVSMYHDISIVVAATPRSMTSELSESLLAISRKSEELLPSCYQDRVYLTKVFTTRPHEVLMSAVTMLVSHVPIRAVSEKGLYLEKCGQNRPKVTRVIYYNSPFLTWKASLN